MMGNMGNPMGNNFPGNTYGGYAMDNAGQMMDNHTGYGMAGS